MKTVSFILRRPMHNEKGFTLLEMLVTLSIFSILLLLPLVTIPKMHSTYFHAAAIAKQLKTDLLLAQQLALSTGREVQVRFDNANKEYVIRFSTVDVYMRRRYLNEEMFIELVTIDRPTLSFLANGHPSRVGTFILQVGAYRFRFTIYLGKGMIYYRSL